MAATRVCSSPYPFHSRSWTWSLRVARATITMAVFRICAASSPFWLPGSISLLSSRNMYCIRAATYTLLCMARLRTIWSHVALWLSFFEDTEPVWSWGLTKRRSENTLEVKVWQNTPRRWRRRRRRRWRRRRRLDWIRLLRLPVLAVIFEDTTNVRYIHYIHRGQQKTWAAAHPWRPWRGRPPPGGPQGDLPTLIPYPPLTQPAFRHPFNPYTTESSGSPWNKKRWSGDAWMGRASLGGRRNAAWLWACNQYSGRQGAL